GRAGSVSGQSGPHSRRQHREHAEAELAEIEDVDDTVVVVIEGGDEPGLSRIQAIARREQSEVGDVHSAVTVDVAEESENSAGIARQQLVVVAAGSVAVTVKLEAAKGDLVGENAEHIVAVGQRTEIRRRSAEVAQHDDRLTVYHARG